MSRFIRSPRNMPRFFQGRMFNRFTGGYAPAGYSGFRPRRATHRGFRTQVSPYGAGGGGRRQYHAGHAGHAGNVYAAMMHHATRQGGVNMGLLPITSGYRGTRMHRGFRQDQASIRRDFQNRIRDERRNLRNAATRQERNVIRGRIADLRGEHRSERRAHAQGINTEWAKGHDFNLGGGRRRQWRPQRGRRTMLSPRMGINVGQDSYTGRRFIQGLNFRRQQGGARTGYNRARARNMRIANRMNTFTPMRGGIPWRHGLDLDVWLHGGQGKRPMGLPATHADFTLGGRRRGWIGRGNHWNTGLNAGRVMRPWNSDRHALPPGHWLTNTGLWQPYSRDDGPRQRMIPQTNRAMTPWERWNEGGRRGPEPLETQPDWNRFDPFHHTFDPNAL